VLAGRSAARLAPLAEALDLATCAVPLDDPDAMAVALGAARVVVHAAGPFSRTARPMLDACLRTGTHYLDLTGEVGVIEALARADEPARRRGIMVMPGVGFEIVPSDCLAARVVHRLPGAARLALATTGFGFVSRGSARTLVESVDAGVVRRRGVLTRVPLGSLRRTFDFGAGPRAAANVSWGDVAAAYYTTGVGDIETYVESNPFVEAVLGTCRAFGWMLRTAPWQTVLAGVADLLPPTPSDGGATREMVIVAEAEDRRGNRAAARLRTPEAYAFTGETAASVAARVLAGDVEPGFQTPARVYGSEFVETLPGVVREDLA
jgi:short subunit dehydrogenase-like uncharacterized protein